MAACPVCGAGNPERARFCLECGTPIGGAPPRSATSRRTVTVLFSDVVGSTALGESLDPETVHVVMSRYFDVMHEVIERHGGTVEKFIGDAIMAVFGLPVLHEDDALRAVRAAIDMREALAAVNAELQAARGVTIATRTGINTGEVMAGDASARQTLVTGDPVNTAARLEQAAGAGEILIGRETWRLVRDVVTAEPVEPIGAKGKAEPVPAHRLLSVHRTPEARGLRFDAPLLGRGPELDRLKNVFEETVANHASALITIVGPAGVGKSRLLAEFIATVADRAQILRGRCLPYGDGITYWPLREVLTSVAGIRDSDSPRAASQKLRDLLEEVPEGSLLADRLASAIGLSTAQASSDEIFWAVRRTLEHLAASRPLILIIEDIHWAEPTLRELLERVAELSRDVTLMIVCPARPELLDLAPEWDARGTNTTITLEGLTPKAAVDLMDALPGGRLLPSELRERILATAEGSPLFIEEVLRMLAEDGSGDQQSTGGGAGARVEVPPTIQALLAARLDRLPADQRSAAQRAAVVGRVFEQPAVVALTPSASRQEVVDSLLALVRKQLVTPELSGLTEEEAFKFRHILARDVAYNALAKADRAQLHERFADWLEEVIGDRALEYQELLGYHLRLAYGYRIELREPAEHTAILGRRAGDHLRAAGRRARSRGDSAAAVQLYLQAQALPVEDRSIRAELLLEYGLALMDLGRLGEVRTPVQDALATATEAEDRRLAARARLVLLDVGLADGTFVTFDAAIGAELQLALDDANSSGDELAQAEAWQAFSAQSWNESRIDESADQGHRALTYAQAAGDVRYALEVEANLLVATFAGPLPASQVMAASAAFVDRSWSYPTVRAEAQTLMAVSEAMLGDFDAATRHAEEGIATLTELGQFGAALNAQTQLAWTYRLAGDLPSAESCLRAAVVEAETSSDLGLATFLSCRLAQVLVEQGRLDEALGPLTVAERNPIGATRSRIAGMRARIAAAHGDAAASHQVDELLAMVEGWHWMNVKTDAYIDAAHAMAAVGDRSAAAAHAREALRLCRAKENVAQADQVELLVAGLAD